MTRRARVRQVVAALASAALLVPVGTIRADAHPRPSRQSTDTVALNVDDVSMTTLNATAQPKPLSVTLTVTNRTDHEIKAVTIEGERGNPIATQSALDTALAHVTPPTGYGVIPIEPTSPVKLDLPPGVQQQVTFETTSSLANDGGLCTCHAAAVYPLYFTAHVIGDGNVDQNLGVAATFVSSFSKAPSPVRVSWVWPLIDQPHLLSDAAVADTGAPLFRDDELAGSVGSGGRLDRALSVVEQVGSDVPMTLLVDPELLYELQLMATHPYEVRVGAKTAPGIGSPVALAWLSRLRTVLGTHPNVHLQLTPFADPDVESLTANGLSWSADLPAQMRRNVAQALGGHDAQTTLAWPAGGAVSGATLSRLVDDGVGTVLLNSSAVSPKPAADAVRPGLARLSVHGRDVAAGLLNPALEKYLGQALTVGRAGVGALPPLLAELAVRATQEPEVQHTAVLAAPRWVDPDVATAVRVVKETSSSAYTRPTWLGDAVGGPLLPNSRSHLAAVPASARMLPATNVSAAVQITHDLPALRSLLTPARPATISPQARQLLAGLPAEAQRVSSAAWGRAGNGQAASAFARALTAQSDALSRGVVIVKPSYSYTLGSDNSPLPITVENNLPYPVTVMVKMTTVNGLPGFTAKPAKEVVEADSKRTLHLPTSIDRTGRIRVQATLLTPDGAHELGFPVQMTVRSTALGAIGVIITIAAGAVLLLALLIRFGRRLRRHKRKPPRRRPHWDPDAPGAEHNFQKTMTPEHTP